MDDNVKKLFENFITVPSKEMALLGRLPSELMLELDNFVTVCRQIKDNKYNFLRQHHNIGNNSFQVSVPTKELENSFIFAYINYLGEYFLSRALDTKPEDFFRKVVLRRHPGHFDNYDFWINFCNKGSINEKHNHSGTLSGIIYYRNDKEEKTNFDSFEVVGQPGDILIFPSYLEHWVDEKVDDSERITFSFNLLWNKES